jgi:hypothetical protein
VILMIVTMVRSRKRREAAQAESRAKQPAPSAVGP